MNTVDIDKMILLLTGGLSRETAEHTAIAKMGYEPAAAKSLVRLAVRRLALAARYNRDEELARAITRLNDLYKQSKGIQDAKTCLAIQRELNKLLSLYQHAPAAESGDGQSPEIEAARKHLAGLFTGGDAMPLVELCRLAAGRILNL